MSVVYATFSGLWVRRGELADQSFVRAEVGGDELELFEGSAEVFDNFLGNDVKIGGNQF